MKETIAVNGCNIADMKENTWSFYASGKEINRRMAIKAMHIGVKVTAELKQRDQVGRKGMDNSEHTQSTKAYRTVIKHRQICESWKLWSEGKPAPLCLKCFGNDLTNFGNDIIDELTERIKTTFF